MDIRSLESTIASRQDEPNRPAAAVAADDDRAEMLERRLVVTFVVVACISMLWNLGTSLQWLWASCISQLHSAVMLAGIS